MRDNKQQKNKKLQPATSLVEVLMVLAIVSVTLINSMVLTTKAMQTVRRDEQIDQANGILVKAVEILKSPALVNVSSDAIINPGVGEYFSLDYSSTSSNPILKKEYSDLGDNCDSTNVYFVDSNDGVAKCLQIKIVPMTTISNRFVMDVKLVYKIRSEVKVNTLRTIRYEGFQKE